MRGIFLAGLPPQSPVKLELLYTRRKKKEKKTSKPEFADVPPSHNAREFNAESRDRMFPNLAILPVLIYQLSLKMLEIT